MLFLSTPRAKTHRAKLLAGALVALTLAAAPALADEPTAAAVALATKLLTEIGLKQSVDIIVPSMMGELERNLSSMHPEMKTALHEVLVADMPDFVKTEAAVLDDIAHVLASRMSEQELKETAAFFESPAGQKYVAAQGPMLQELSVSGSAWRQKLSGDMLTRIREDLKKKGVEF
jgi:hypothetical protein